MVKGPLGRAGAPIMAELIQVNGSVVARGDATVSLFDRGFLLGDAVFETMRAHHGRVFMLDAHLARLARGVEVLGLDRAPAPSTLREQVVRAVSASGLPSAVLRLTVARGEGPRGIGTAGYDRPTVALVVSEPTPLPEWAYQDGIDTRIVRHRRLPTECIEPDIKHANYLPSILGRRELNGPRELEGLVLSVSGEVVSGLASNVFVIQGGELWTPPLASGCLPGVTRAVVLSLAADAGVAAHERPLWPDDLARADELFFTNTLFECLPVARLAGRPLSGAPGPVTRALHAALRQRIDRDCRGVDG